jgi:hypothetical protein
LIKEVLKIHINTFESSETRMNFFAWRSLKPTSRNKGGKKERGHTKRWKWDIISFKFHQYLPSNECNTIGWMKTKTLDGYGTKWDRAIW